ncbi:nuclear transport factor 2 family protein [Stagnimonas aquatica]|uniref:Nuclear transport factor 2 family protein n=1 Tax=Stagnimonas aquatica TaxID=2689987 RepID=A0A3N0VLE2_9GAMM|nr:nuclear transport factor 2 family protein [Stagnimonas aquatica]ROH93569.1 nuclear transport factor 2 family protein [Stagnimonas aquatica]
MNNHLAVCALAANLVLSGCAATPQVSSSAAPQTPGPLFDKILALDTEVFSAFNTCAEAGQLQKHAGYFSESVEFYHDNGGVTWNRADMIANTEKFVCGNFRRELVAGSLRVYPIKDFGAIAQGVHRFCQFKSGACEGTAEFVIVWRQEGDKWLITRVLSYGHRPA